MTMNFPPIYPVPEGVERPFWSVMIPTYNPKQHYLEKTINSIIVQAIDGKDMQIELIDDCSTNFNPEDFLKKTRTCDGEP